MTMINGNIVYKDGILKGVDERKLALNGEAMHKGHPGASQCLRESYLRGILFKGKPQKKGKKVGR